jgi:hypothetical protein
MGPPPPLPPGQGRQQGWGARPVGRPGGAYWYQLPPVPKPGVIPLRPLGLSDILEGAVSTVRAHWRTVFGISLSVAVTVQAVSTLVTGVFFQHSGTDLNALQNNPDATLGQALRALRDLMASTATTAIIGVLGQMVATALLTLVVSRSVLGRPVTSGETWRDARPQMPRLLGMMLLAALISIAAVGVGIAPGLVVAAAGQVGMGAALGVLGGALGVAAAVWFSVSLSLAAPALMLERQGVRAAMTRSFRLVRGSWWRVFGIQFVAGILVLLITSVLSIPFTTIASLASSGGDAANALVSGAAPTGWGYLVIVAIGSAVGSTLALPLSAGVVTLLYMDQRIRREGLDIELARAAGIQGYGANTGSPSVPGQGQ